MGYWLENLGSTTSIDGAMNQDLDKHRIWKGGQDENRDIR